MEDKEFWEWRIAAAMFLVLVGLLVIAGYSFEIITFSLATQRMFSSDFNCELEFNEASDMNYSGHWNCKFLQERM